MFDRATQVKLATFLALVALATTRAGVAATLLDAQSLTKYVDPLPQLDNVIAPSGTLDGAPLYDITISQFQQRLHSQLQPTTLWGYNGVYPGPTFDVNRDQTIRVRWTNNLVDSAGQPLKHFLPYDGTLHGAAPAGGHAGHGAAYPQARTVTHLHGAVTTADSDGYPEHWFSADPFAPANGLGGPAGNSLVTTYANPQRAATMWYHDHAMAITRLNVYAGMAGMYLLRDAEENSLNLPSGAYEIPLLIQDRSFYDDGSLYYPGANEMDPTGAGTHVSSFLGDVNLVNGKVWPHLEVEPRKYRFRMLNAANTRSYELSIVPDDPGGMADSVTLHQIGSDGGLFGNRVDRSSLELFPSDRADVVVDFSQFTPGQTLRLMNSALGAGDGIDEVMQFRVVPSTGGDASMLPFDLSTIERYRPEDAVRVRQLQLVRGFDESGELRLTLDGKRWTDPVSEIMTLGELEIWEITNTTGEDHPIHLHLEAFQVLSRQRVNGAEIPLAEHDRGWEDTFAVRNGETVRFAVKYSKYTGTFVWHCHILEHEDHEMMRPLKVAVPEPASTSLTVAGLAWAFGQRRRKRRPSLPRSRFSAGEVR